MTWASPPFGTDRQAAALEQIAPRTQENYQRTLEDIIRLIRAVGV